MKRVKFIQFIILVLIFGYISSCKSDKNHSIKQSNHETEAENIAENPLSFSISEKKEKYVAGDQIVFSIEGSKINSSDSINLFLNGKKISVLSTEKKTYTWNTKLSKVGLNVLEIELKKDAKRFKKQIPIILLSDIVPEKYTYRIKNIYKHDVHAYTQGLFFHKGFLYEATGLKGESTVRKVKLETGEIIKSFAIPKDIFGEGIVLYDNKIIQLSWESGRGFVYDFDTFKIIDEFSYSGEGWGICTNGTQLFMTNGSEEIKILETQSFSEIDKIQVYDNKAKVIYLNESEYINGAIFCNIYQYEKIVKIDPSTGKVLAYIDLSGILPMNDYTTQTDVLNGIAFDEEKQRLFVTGKKWPKLFEIELVKK